MMIQSSFCTIVAALGLLPLVPASARHQVETNQGKPSQAAPAALPANFILVKQPEGAKPVEAVKESAKAGDQVLVRGRIGGSVAPFVEGRAMFTLVGAGLKPCSDNPEDHCKTPWDYCCDTPDTIAKHSLTVQVVDVSGTPLRIGIKGVGGIKELSDIIVQGSVKKTMGNVMVINATGIFVVKP